MGETEVALYLVKEYSEVMDTKACRFPDFPTKLELPQSEAVWFVPHWTGLWGAYPGTGCGNQPGESLHSPWQRALAAQGGKLSLDSIFPTMNDIYKNLWSRSFDWTSDTCIGVDPKIIDQNLLHGTQLAALGRTPALDFVSATSDKRKVHLIRVVADNVGVVAMSRVATESLD